MSDSEGPERPDTQQAGTRDDAVEDPSPRSRAADPLPATRPSPGGPSTVVPAPAGRRGWLPLAVAFFVGLALGAVGWAAARPTDTTSAAKPAVTVTVTSTAGSGTSAGTAVVNIPAECRQISTEAGAVKDLIAQAVDAATSLDATKLSSIIRQIDTEQQKLTDATTSCTAALGASSTS